MNSDVLHIVMYELLPNRIILCAISRCDSRCRQTKKNLMIMLKENLLGTELLFEMKACHLDIVIERGMTSS